MNIKPSENKKLYGLESYFNELINLYDQNKMPNKILLSGKKGLGKATLAYHLINYILSIDEDYKYNQKELNINEKNKSYNLVKNNTHPNFHLVDLLDEKKNIDISQIRKMITYTNKSSFNNKPRLILIDNLEKLNLSSSNSLLKVIEEPNANVFFILIHNNEKKIMLTLKSRCITFKINLPFDQSIVIFNYLNKENLYKLINIDLINHYSTHGDFIRLVNFAKEKKIKLTEFSLSKFLELLISKSFYKKDNYVRNLLYNLIELYLYRIYRLSSSKDDITKFYQNFIKKINYTDRFNLDEETLFLEFKLKILNG